MSCGDAPEPMFYCPELSAAAGELTLSGEEARHAHSARRLAAGDTLWLFDGRGTIARAAVRAFERRTGTLRLALAKREQVALPWPQITLACALPKGERQAVLLDMATQLGMSSFRPLICERSVVRPGPSAQRRWERICLQACKQSRRAHLPAIEEPLTPARVPALAADGYRIWLADPEGAAIATCTARATLPDRLLLVVGPEGGFTPTELKVFDAAGAQRVSLGRGILRIETAALALLAHLRLRETT